MLLKNKTILVTGAAGLLGSRVSADLLKNGAKVVATDVSKKAISQRLREQGDDVPLEHVEVAKLDVTDEEAVTRFFDELDTVDGAVNCSYPRNSAYGAHFFDVSLANFNDNVALHLGSAFLFTQQCARYFKRVDKPFSLVNISSIYGVVTPDFSVYEDTAMTMPVEYAAIKSAIQHISRYAAAYVNNSKFRVNCVSPGGILDKQPEAFLAAYRERTHGKGMLDVEDITGSIVFLLSDLSRHITGENLVIDDGFTL